MMQSWQRIAQRDPYLSGHIAAREYEWWDRPDPESVADSVNLTGDQRATFIRSWHISLQELAQEQEERKQQELTAFLDACSDGYDPAIRTKWDGIV